MEKEAIEERKEIAGAVDARMEEWKDALAKCNEDIQANGVSAARLYVRAKCFENLGESHKALSDVNESIRLHTDLNSIELKASILCELGQFTEAISLMEQHESADTSGTITRKIAEYKAACKEECGLTYNDPEVLKMERLFKWIGDKGAMFKHLRMKFYKPDYRGIHSCSKIIDKEPLLVVPRHLIITQQNGKETELGKLLLASNVQLNWDYLVYIAVFLLTEMHKPDSEWKPYLDLYPRLVDTFPMFYNEHEKSLLKGSCMLESISNEYCSIKEEYQRILAAVPAFSIFTFEEYIKNKVLVISRVFFAKIDGKEENIMVPLADMFNHHPEKLGQTHWEYCEKERAFIVTAQKAIEKGVAIYESYGSKINYRYLYYYGFLIEKNPQDGLYIELHLDKDDPKAIAKYTLIGQTRRDLLKFCKYYENYNDFIGKNNKVLGYIRFAQYAGDVDALRMYLVPQAKLHASARLKVIMPAISIENEKAMLLKLREIAKSIYYKYPQVYYEDVKILQKGGLTYNERNAILYRAGEKKILQDIIEMAELGLMMLDGEFLFAEKCFKKKA